MPGVVERDVYDASDRHDRSEYTVAAGAVLGTALMFADASPWLPDEGGVKHAVMTEIDDKPML
jgi:hypothetical protein